MVYDEEFRKDKLNSLLTPHRLALLDSLKTGLVYYHMVFMPKIPLVLYRYQFRITNV